MQVRLDPLTIVGRPLGPPSMRLSLECLSGFNEARSKLQDLIERCYKSRGNLQCGEIRNEGVPVLDGLRAMAVQRRKELLRMMEEEVCW